MPSCCVQSGQLGDELRPQLHLPPGSGPAPTPIPVSLPSTLHLPLQRGHAHRGVYAPPALDGRHAAAVACGGWCCVIVTVTVLC